MKQSLTLFVNGRPHAFEVVSSRAALLDLIASLELKPDRIAVEHNGDIAPRSEWATTPITDGDRIEIVHFVGGGL